MSRPVPLEELGELDVESSSSSHKLDDEDELDEDEDEDDEEELEEESELLTSLRTLWSFPACARSGAAHQAQTKAAAAAACFLQPIIVKLNDRRAVW